MNRRQLSLLTLCVWLSASVALAAPPSERTLACVSASTQGQVERDRGLLLAARTQFHSCAQAACPSIVSSSCSAWLVDLEQRIPSLVVRVSEPDERDLTGASVRIDGAAVTLDGRPVQLDPGAHNIVVSAPGWLAAERTLVLAEREQARLLVIELQRSEESIAAPTAEREQGASLKPQRFHVPVASWVLGGLGVAGVASFAVLRVTAGSELAHLQETCSPECPRSSSERGRNLALAADVSLGIGAAALAGAAAWVLGNWLWHERGRAHVAGVPTHGGALAVVHARY
jgi:hypothetical protein